MPPTAVFRERASQCFAAFETALVEGAERVPHAHDAAIIRNVGAVLFDTYRRRGAFGLDQLLAKAEEARVEVAAHRGRLAELVAAALDAQGAEALAEFVARDRRGGGRRGDARRAGRSDRTCRRGAIPIERQGSFPPEQLLESPIDSFTQVGRPWLHWPERGVTSISRSSAFISATERMRPARTEPWQAMVAATWSSFSLRRSASSKAARSSARSATRPLTSRRRARRERAHQHRARPEALELEPEFGKLADPRLEPVAGGLVELDDFGDQQRLAAATPPPALAARMPLEHEPLVRGVLVDDHQPVLGLGDDIGRGDLPARHARAGSRAALRRGSAARPAGRGTRAPRRVGVTTLPETAAVVRRIRASGAMRRGCGASARAASCRAPPRSRACDAALAGRVERMAQAADDEAADTAGIAEADLGLGGVDVDVDLIGRERRGTARAPGGDRARAGPA